MRDIKKLLEARKIAKRRKPHFVRQGAYSKAEVSIKWRRPKGLHSKMRRSLKGYKKTIRLGYRSPPEVRGMHSSGLEKKLIHNEAMLKEIDPKKTGIIIAKIGNKKKLDVLKKAIELKITIFNVKDAQKEIDQIEKAFQERKSKKSEQKTAKDQKKKEKEKKAAEKGEKGIEKKLEKSETGTAEAGKETKDIKETKLAEKKELDKTLITKAQ